MVDNALKSNADVVAVYAPYDELSKATLSALNQNPNLKGKVKVYGADISTADIHHHVWRRALNAGMRHDGAAAAMGAYVAAVAFGTSPLGMERHAFAQALARSVSPICARSPRTWSSLSRWWTPAVTRCCRRTPGTRRASPPTRR